MKTIMYPAISLDGFIAKPELKLELLSINQDVKGITQNHYKVLNTQN